MTDISCEDASTFYEDKLYVSCSDADRLVAEGLDSLRRQPPVDDA